MKQLFRNLIVTLFVIVFMGAAGELIADDETSYAIVAGKILTMAEPGEKQNTPNVINHGVILVSNGKIEALGPKAKLKIPDGYVVIDASDRWVTPGIIEAHCHNGADIRDLNDMVMQVNPELRASDCVWEDDFGFKKAISGGVTTIHTMPGSGTNQAGFTVIIKTDSSDPSKMILRQVGAMKATQAFNPERGLDLGRTRMGMSWLLRQMLDKAKAYDQAWNDYESGKTKDKPDFKPEWEDCRKVFSHEIPVIVHTYDGWGVMQTARMFGKEYNLKTIATHTAYAGHMMAEDVAKFDNVSINIGPRLLDFHRSIGNTNETRGNRFWGMGSQYTKGGVRNLSINTDSVRWSHRIAPLQELFYQASVSAHLGLDEMTAMKAITINSAKALHVDDRVGSLEVGKDADIVIKKGSLLDVSAPVDIVLINGKVAYQREGVKLIADSRS